MPYIETFLDPRLVALRAEYRPDPTKPAELQSSLKQRLKPTLVPQAQALVGTALTDEIKRTSTKLKSMELRIEPVRAQWKAQVDEATSGRSQSAVPEMPTALDSLEREKARLEVWLEVLDEHHREILAEISPRGPWDGPKTQQEWDELKRQEAEEARLFAQFRQSEATASAKAAAKAEQERFQKWKAKRKS